MPTTLANRRARRAKRAGKSASSQAGEFVGEELRHIRRGVHGARSAKQAIAIGLSKARRSGIDLPPPPKNKASKNTVKNAERVNAVGKGERKPQAPSSGRSRAGLAALKRESRSAASHRALSRQARAASKRRIRAERTPSHQQPS